MDNTCALNNARSEMVTNDLPKKKAALQPTEKRW